MKTNIKRRKLGKTGLMVSELSLGAMNLRLLKSFAEAEEMVSFVLDQGINLIDTARAYKGEIAPGITLESEDIVGKVISQKNNLDEPIVVITKGHAYTIPEMEEDLTTSLKTLQVTGKGNLKIGENDIKLIYLIHGLSDERWTTIKESGVLDELQKLKKEGVINYIGFSSHYPFVKEVKEAVDLGIFDVVELPYNIFNRTFGENGELNLFKYIYGKNIGIINMKAFNGNGMIPLFPIIKEYVSIDYQAMLRFCLSNPYISTVDAGTKYPKEFSSDMQVATGSRYTEQELIEMRKEADKVAPHLQNICRKCMHCQEKFTCPNEIDFPEILSLYNHYTFLTRENKDTTMVINKYNLLSKNGDDCIECGECLPWCEYKLNIPGLLKKAHEVLGK